MARVVIQNVWQQKHPTPTHGAWEFHFHPRDLPAKVSERIASMDVGLSQSPLTAWAIEPDHLIWIRSFVAVVPSEQRRYTGVAGVIATPAPGHEAAWSDALPSLIAGLTPPPAVPWASGTAAAPSEPRTIEVASAPAIAPIDEKTWPPFPATLDAARAIAHALLLGGAVGVQAPLDDRLPRVTGTLMSWIPSTLRASSRRGAFVEGHAPPRAATNRPAARNLLHYLARAWVPPREIVERTPGFPAYVWRLVADVAKTGVNVVELFDELTEMAESWDDARDLERYLLRSAFTNAEVAACDRRAPAPLFAETPDAGLLWNRVLNYWGRGLLRRPDDEDALLRRLATILAYRILVDHLFHLDSLTDAELPRRYLRRLQYEALLPAQRMNAVLSSLGKTMPTLFERGRS